METKELSGGVGDDGASWGVLARERCGEGMEREGEGEGEREGGVLLLPLSTKRMETG